MTKPRSKKSGRSTRVGCDECKRLMAAYGASALNQRTFCAEHGVACSTFYYRRRQLRDEEAADREATLVELLVPGGSGTGAWCVELDLGDGLVLRLR